MSPFELSSCCSCHVFSYFFAYFLLLKRVKCPPFFVFTTKTTQPRPHCLKVSLFFPFLAIISESLGRVFFFDSLLSSNTVLIFLLYYTRLYMKSPSFDKLEKLIFLSLFLNIRTYLWLKSKPNFRNSHTFTHVSWWSQATLINSLTWDKAKC